MEMKFFTLYPDIMATKPMRNSELCFSRSKLAGLK